MNTIGHREGTQRLDLAIFQKDFNFSAITPLFTPFSTTSNHHISSKNTHSTTRRVDFMVVFISHSIEKWVNTSLSSCAREIYPFKPQLQCTIPTLQNAIFILQPIDWHHQRMRNRVLCSYPLVYGPKDVANQKVDISDITTGGNGPFPQKRTPLFFRPPIAKLSPTR